MGGEIGRGMIGHRTAVRATGAARPRAGSERLVDDGFDGARAASAFGTAAQTIIDLLGVTRKVVSSAYGIADIMVAKDVAGTDDHSDVRTFGKTKRWRLKSSSLKPSISVSSIWKLTAGCKRKNLILKQFQTGRDAGWNESKVRG